MTTERIAAAIKPIIDEDRRADRERIAELERDLAALRCARENADSALEEHNIAQAKLIITLNKQLDELTEKCAALVVENKRLADGKAPTLRIDTDMSDPQPGKLLIVRLDADDVGRGWVELGDLTENGRGKDTQNFWPEQRVGFLVETPAVGVKRTPKVGDSVRLTVSGWEGETAKIVDVKGQSAALALDEVGVDVKRFSFDCFEVIE